MFTRIFTEFLTRIIPITILEFWVGKANSGTEFIEKESETPSLQNLLTVELREKTCFVYEDSDFKICVSANSVKTYCI